MAPPAVQVIRRFRRHGSLVAAMFAGKPCVATPFASEQFDTAACVKDLGVGVGVRDQPLQ